MSRKYWEGFDSRASKSRKRNCKRREEMESHRHVVSIVDGEKGSNVAIRGAAMSMKSPAQFLGNAIADALNPDLAPRPVKSFATMTEDEREEMRRKYAKR